MGAGCPFHHVHRVLLTAQITGLAQRRFSVAQKEEGGRGERRMEGKKKGREEGRKGGEGASSCSW